MNNTTSKNKHSANLSTWLWQVVIILLLTCVFLSLYLKNNSNTLYRANKNQLELMSLGYEMQEYSDYLTAQARGFAVTNEPTFLENYWDEVLLHKNRDAIVDRIMSYSHDPAERQLLIDSKRNSDDLINTEIQSMKLVLSVYNIPNKLLPIPIQSYKLNKTNLALSPQQRIIKAQQILFDKQYDIHKKSITDPINDYNQTISTHLKDTLIQSEKKCRMSNVVLTLLLIFSLLFTIGSLWVKYKRYSVSNE